MPRKSKPWWWGDRGRWATTVAGKRVVAPPEVETEHDAWAWHAEVVRESTPRALTRSTTTVQDVLEAYAEWDAAAVAAGSRNAATAENDLSLIGVVVNTRVGGRPFGLMLVARLTPSHYDALLAEWRRGGRSPGYVQILAAKLKTFLRWASRPAVDRGPLIEASPFAACKTPLVQPGGERYGDRAMAARWLRFLWRSGYRDDAAFQRCLIHTGARPSELAWAEWGEVRWDAARDGAGNPMAVVVRARWKNAKKTGRARRVFLPARLVRMMRRRGEGRGAADPIFPRPTGGKFESTAVGNRTAWLRKKAKEKGLTFAEADGRPLTNYLWRHIAASDLLMSGVDVATVAELLGTGVIQIQRTYGHLLSDHLARASEKLGRRKAT